MILEGLVTTTNEDGGANLAPMGAVLADSGGVPERQFVLRPFEGSTTLANLKRNGQGVFHVTDDVELLARAAVGRIDRLPEMTAASAVDGWILTDACRWYAFRVRRLDESHEPAEIDVDVVDRGRIRDFFGFNRAKHAVVEAAILATRTGLIPDDEIRAEFDRLAVLVEKTGGARERAAFALLDDYIGEGAKEKR